MLQRIRRPWLVGMLLPVATTVVLAACGGGQPAPEAAQPTALPSQIATATRAPVTAPTEAATQVANATQPAAVAATEVAAATQAPVASATPAEAAPSAVQPASEKGLPVGQTPEGYWYLGTADAPVTLVMYSDFL